MRNETTQSQLYIPWCIRGDMIEMFKIIAGPPHQTQSLPPPLMWWKATASFGVPSSFIFLASLLLGTPPSSVSIERIFSCFGAIHTKIRNRLGNEKTAKLVFCYRMLLDFDD